MFTLASPDWNYADSITTGMPGTFEAGAGNDILVSQEPTDDTYGRLAPTRFFGGGGDDSINPPQQTSPGEIYEVEAYGGSGDDTINGSNLNDTLYGDTADSFTGDPVVASVVLAPYDTSNDGDDVISGFDGDDTISGDGGDDQLFGGDGSDTLTGGDGNDFLFGGPRGSGNLDILTGGAGADTFLLSYNQDSANAGAGFWGAYLEQAGQNIAGNAANAIFTDAIKAAEDGLAAGFMADGLGAIGGQLVSSFIGLVESLASSGQPRTAQDVMVVTDFDPREDVLVLPLQSTALETLTVNVVDANQIPGGGTTDGKVLSFEAGSKVYAYVELSQDFLTAMGLQGTGDATEQVLNNLVNFSSGIALQDGKTGFTNLVSSSVSDQLPDGGFQPQEADLPAGASVLLYGAIGGVAIANGASGESFGSVLAGTNFSDALTTNPHLVDPSLITEFAGVGAFIHGFAGDDLVYGTDQPDTLFGDDGDDTLYSFATTVGSDGDDAENLSGGAGNDLLYGGGSAGNFDGGDGTDTFAVVYSAGKAVLQLAVDLTTGQAAEHAAPSDTSAPVGDAPPFPFAQPNSYALTGIENAIGGSANDWLKGADGSVIEGAAGADYLDATAQDVTVSYASSGAGVSVQLYAHGSVASGGDAEGDVIGYNNLVDVNGLIGSTQSDTLGVDFFGNFINLTGNGGSDVFQMLGLDTVGECTITDFSQSGAEADKIDLRALGVTSMAEVMLNGNLIEVGNPPSGSGLLEITLENFTGTLAASDFLFASAVSSPAVAGRAGDGLVGSERDDRLFGRAGDDYLFGTGGIDHLGGRGGKDVLHGGDGDDLLIGGLGNDLFDGGLGADRMRGGKGADTFVLRFGETDGDQILDFSRTDGDRLSIVGDTAITVTAGASGTFLLTDGNVTESLIVKGGSISDFGL